MGKEVLDILNRIALERNIPVDTLHTALEAALISASKKMLPGDVDVVEAEFDRDSGEFRIYANMEVVEEVEDEHTQIPLEEAREYVDDVSPGEFLVIDVTPDDFGRIAAQSAKQVITQRLREAEREMIYDRYKNRTGDLVAGTVQRYEKGNVVVDLGNAEAILPPGEQAVGERYRYGDRIRAIIADIRKSSKDAQIILSRSTPELVLKLFEQEVAEIRDGIVSIRLIAREAGRRTKIAVLSSDSDVDPVGACVGMKGSRVQMVVQELRGERIDIIEYSDDKKRFVANSLKPANVESVELDPISRRALLVVRDDDLALAIGKNGLNAKLASELTGVEIDIITETQLNEREAAAKQELYLVPTLQSNQYWVDALLFRGLIHCRDIIRAGEQELVSIEGINEDTAKQILRECREVMQMSASEAEEENAAAAEGAEATAQEGSPATEETASDEEVATAEEAEEQETHPEEPSTYFETQVSVEQAASTETHAAMAESEQAASQEDQPENAETGPQTDDADETAQETGAAQESAQPDEEHDGNEQEQPSAGEEPTETGGTTPDEQAPGDEISSGSSPSDETPDDQRVAPETEKA